MPSDQSTWLLAVPETEGFVEELSRKLTSSSRSFPRSNIAPLVLPLFKTGTLDHLIILSEDLPKLEHSFTSTVAKIVDTLRNLFNNDPSKLAQHILVNERSVDDYLLGSWKWNEGRYGIQRGLREITDALNKEMTSIDNAMKAKLNNYNFVKGSLAQMQRKKTGNLSVRSLVNVVSKEDFIEGSEHLETLLVAVPRNSTKDWNAKYERLTTMIVPRSSRSISSDDEYTLFGVVLFKRVHDEFVQRCRENKYIVRDFVYSEAQITKERQELEMAGTTEKELWAELLQLSRTNFSESFQILVHMKVVRLFVESVLLYGLPAVYTGVAIKPEAKSSKTLSVLTNHLAYLRPKSEAAKAKKGNSGSAEFIGEYQSVLEQDFFDFVLCEVPWIVN